MNMHSWPDHALNLVNSIASISGIVAAALVLISFVLIYFSRAELRGRTGGIGSLPEMSQTKQSNAELKAARRSEKETAARLVKLEKELTAAQQSDKVKLDRLGKMEKELAAAHQSEREKTARLAQFEKDLKTVQESEKAKASRVSQLEGEIAAAREAEKARTTRVTQLEAELTTARQSEKSIAARVAQIETELSTARQADQAKVARITEIEAELAAAKDSEEAKTKRVTEVEAELATARTSAEEAKTFAKELEAKQGRRKITQEQRSQFLNAINGHARGKIIVSAFFDNKETHDFGAEIQGLLKESGFQLIEQAPLNFFTTSRPSSGVRIGCANISDAPPHFFTIRKALEAMGVETPTASLINAKESDVVEIQITPRQ